MQSPVILKPRLKIVPTIEPALLKPIVEPQEATLRPYQESLKKEIYGLYRKGLKSVLVVASGGLGKTRLAAWIMRDRSIRAKRPARSIFLVERNCLLEQTANTLALLGVDCSIIQGSKKVKWDHPCMVASLQTLRSWHDRDPKVLTAIDLSKVLTIGLVLNPLTKITAQILATIPNQKQILSAHDGAEYLTKMLGKVGMFILDEAHDGVGQRIYQILFDTYSSDDKCLFLGLTASPWRMKKEEWLGRWYNAKVESLQPPEAIKLGWLVQSRNFSKTGVLDVSKIGIGEDGDYSDAQMGKQAMRPEALQLIVDEWKRLGEGKPTIVFCSTVAQAKAQAECFVSNGITADYQSGGTPKGSKEQYEKELAAGRIPSSTRYAHDNGLRSGTIKVICSVKTQTKGYDCPPIACVIFAKATKSKSEFFQAAWRGCRPYTDPVTGEKKEYFILLDFGGNLDDGNGGGHGNPMGFHDYDISEPRSKKRSDEPVNMIKDCPDCGAELSIFAKVCKCGFEFGDKFDDEQQEIFDPSLYMLKEWFDPIGCEQIQFLRTEKRRCYNQNENPDLAAERFKERFGYVPPPDWHQWAVLGNRSTKSARSQYTTYLEHHAPHAFWVKVQLRLEMGDDSQAPPQFLAEWNKPWWDVLGVSKIDPKETIKSAYLTLAKQWHPDTCDDRENAENQMKILNKAWEEYKNEQRN